MNTFALILLAFPFYLAVNGKLTNYTDLVSSASQTPAASNSSAPASAPAQGAQ